MPERLHLFVWATVDCTARVWRWTVVRPELSIAPADCEVYLPSVLSVAAD
jgi:hypothetical protein